MTSTAIALEGENEILKIKEYNVDGNLHFAFQTFNF